MDLRTGQSVMLDSAEPVPDYDLIDWIWPAADTFTDESITPRTSQTCSELGSQRIRLIKISPGNSSDVIECETRVCFLPEAGKYNALSYVWGSTVPRCHIIVDKEARQVTTNLWRFLWQARQQPELFSGWLWIDALSINQFDPWEKLAQVEIISDIFRSATQAVVWLGPAYGESDKAMRILPATVPDASRKLSRAFYAPPLGPALLWLCERAYWRRLWVFQELKCSRKIFLMCGVHFVDFRYLDRFLLAENTDERLDVHCKSRIHQSSAAQMVRLIRRKLNTSLRSMLRATRHLRCADPRDKVYAILNTISPDHQDIKPDYTTTLPILINKILRNMHITAEPTELSAVGEQCLALADEFGGDATSVFGDGMISAASGIDVEAMFESATVIMMQLQASVGVATGTRLNSMVSNSCLLLDQVIHRLPSLPISQLEKAKTLVREAHRWCKAHDHRKIGALVREQLERARREREESSQNIDKSDKASYLLLQKEMQQMIRLFDEFC